MKGISQLFLSSVIRQPVFPDCPSKRLLTRTKALLKRKVQTDVVQATLDTIQGESRDTREK